jgi:hypothetical protein
MYTKTLSDRVEERKGALFQAVPFLNCPKLFGRHFESRSTGMTKEQLLLMSYQGIMPKVIHPFLEDE